MCWLQPSKSINIHISIIVQIQLVKGSSFTYSFKTTWLEDQIFLSTDYNESEVHAFPPYYMYAAISNSCSCEQNLTHTHARPKHSNQRVETHLLIEGGKEYQIINIVIDEQDVGLIAMYCWSPSVWQFLSYQSLQGLLT